MDKNVVGIFFSPPVTVYTVPFPVLITLCYPLRKDLADHNGLVKINNSLSNF